MLRLDKMTFFRISLICLVVILTFSACDPQPPSVSFRGDSDRTNDPVIFAPTPIPLPARPVFTPGELVDYTAQTGDTLPALAAHFNTSIQEIIAANSIIPSDATSLPPGLPMKIPIYHRNFWGSQYQIIPDSHYINGPKAVSFDTADFMSQYSGWLKKYTEYVEGENRNGAEIIDFIAQNYSISPRVLLAVAEYLAGALTKTTLPQGSLTYPLGYRNYHYRGVYRQLIWAANRLNNGYYGWRSGELIEFDLPDESLERPDPWQNAASVGVQHLFSEILPTDQYHLAVGPAGFAQTYQELFGNPWVIDDPHIPGSLTQPGLIFPFEPGKVWAFTGGPHTGWGTGAPWAALDFAPASDITGCYISYEWVTAMAPGMIVQSGTGFIVQDLDQDGDPRTGWTIFYLHVSNWDQIPLGTFVEAGTPIAHPSCEGGSSTGIADSAIPFIIEGWMPKQGELPYEGTLTRFESTITACVCADQETNIMATGNPDGIP
jgi:murein DD-endopeptidase MepM/ murein hydrolase activator NlpD